VKELYERWTVGDANGGEPATEAAPVASGGLPATQFNDPAGNGRTCILFVHGWNMAPWEKDAFAETAFKRLYWQGYTNRFASFRWPTTYGFTGAITALTDGRNYDNGEFCAWRSAEGLRRKLVQMNQTYPGKVYVVAHSMGNVVAGEALALQAEKFGGGQIVNTYVASQAAVPMHCYNSSVPPSYQLGFQRTAGIFIGNFESFTPNVYPCWLSTNRVACAARVNFYNPHDWALAADVWQLNQILKPDYSLAGSGYGYQGFQNRAAPRIGTGGAAVPVHQIPSPARRGLTAPPFRQVPGTFWAANLFLITRRLDFEYKLQDMYEVMSYASEARSYPIGVVADSTLLERRLNLWNVWPADDEPDIANGAYGRHKWHSAQFRSNYVRQERYWRNLIGRNGLAIFQDR
jgi:pimeloyl-ACP methyl ester carboxylesterase